MSCDCSVTCLFIVQKKIKKRKENEINIKSKKLNKRKEKLSVSKVFHNTLTGVTPSWKTESNRSISAIEDRILRWLQHYHKACCEKGGYYEM